MEFNSEHKNVHGAVKARGSGQDALSGIAEKSDEGTSTQGKALLAFAFDEKGNPKVICTFTSNKDKFALLGIARAVIDKFTAELTSELIQPLLSG